MEHAAVAFRSFQPALRTRSVSCRWYLEGNDSMLVVFQPGSRSSVAFPTALGVANTRNWEMLPSCGVVADWLDFVRFGCFRTANWLDFVVGLLPLLF